MSGARPGVEMRTRRSPTATWRASGLAGRTPMTRCDVSFASNDTPSGPGGARTSRMCSFATTGSAVTTSASYTLSMSLGLPELLAGCLYKLLLLADGTRCLLPSTPTPEPRTTRLTHASHKKTVGLQGTLTYI